ncbi:MAG TPA: hypothetical protein VD699_05555 [Nitrosopumilaceae archaeon]|nr:hypothetical protein [Nitrosopumilaceae archaeon]HXV39016.1 hypothetical protein [Nitrosopumilaceae archaeon]
MARIRLKLGANEIEVDSKDFYVDNQSVDEVISNLSRYVAEETKVPNSETAVDYLSSLEDAEIHEPEFTAPISIDSSQIRSKIHILVRDSFFEQPRTVSEVVAQLYEYGWAARPLDVSKILVKMALNRELQKDSQEKRSYYSNKLVQIR